MRTTKILLLFFSLFILFSCERSYKKQLKFSVKGLEPTEVQIQNYGDALFGIDTDDFQSSLELLKTEYPYFLDADLGDSSLVMQLYNFITDPYLIELHKLSQKAHPSFAALETQLTEGFRRFHHYYPNLAIPGIYSYISGIQYEEPVYTDGQHLVFGIDCYLGQDAPPYQQMGIPRYISERMREERIAPDIFAAIYDFQLLPEKPSATIVEEMIQVGKRLFFIESMLPSVDERFIIGYSKEQLAWVKEHEAAVWTSFVGEQLLYKDDQLLFRKLFGDAPFSKEFAHEAPARLGEWIGWQIIRSFMDQHPDMCIVKLLGISDAQDILNRSHYKPK